MHHRKIQDEFSSSKLSLTYLPCRAGCFLRVNSWTIAGTWIATTILVTTSSSGTHSMFSTSERPRSYCSISEYDCWYPQASSLLQMGVLCRVEHSRADTESCLSTVPRTPQWKTLQPSFDPSARPWCSGGVWWCQLMHVSLQSLYHIPTTSLESGSGSWTSFVRP